LEAEQKQQVEAFNQSNDGYTTAGVIQIRLDTGPLLDQLEAYLRGTRLTGYKETGDGAMIPIYQKIGKEKMNDNGVQSVMSWLTPIISPHTVQGNYPTVDDLQEYLCRVEQDIYCYLMINLEEFEISLYEIDGVTDMIMNTVEPFLTRTIQNKERESYAATATHSERIQQSSSGGLFGFGQR